MTILMLCVYYTMQLLAQSVKGSVLSHSLSTEMGDNQYILVKFSLSLIELLFSVLVRVCFSD